MQTAKQLTKADVHSGSLILVNAQHPIAQSCPPPNRLACVGQHENRMVLLEHTAAKMMMKLLEAVNTDGSIVSVSGYRTRAEQLAIWNSTLADKGESFTRKFVALPGCSEHETGLALDLGNAQKEVDFITPDFPEEGAFAKLKALAPMYGFIERYPENKTQITGIGYEPWHYRYVGWPHSAIMVKNEWTLEEYTRLLYNHRGAENAFIYTEHGYSAKIWLCAPENTNVADLPQNTALQISGNNIDSVVVTLWQ